VVVSATLVAMTLGPVLHGVLFDWDGTLLDSYHADSQAYLAMFRVMGVNWGLQELEHHYSPDWYTVYRAARIPEARWDEADRVWRAYYAKHPSKLMAATRRVLAQLNKRHKLGLVSSGDRERVSRQLQQFRLTSVFRTRVLGGDTKEKKPHPAPLLKALKEMRLRRGHCVYVGDTPGGCGDGAGSGSEGDRGAGTVSDGETVAGSEAGDFAEWVAGVAESFAGIIWRLVAHPFRGEVFPSTGANGDGPWKPSGLKA